MISKITFSANPKNGNLYRLNGAQFMAIANQVKPKITPNPQSSLPIRRKPARETTPHQQGVLWFIETVNLIERAVAQPESLNPGEKAILLSCGVTPEELVKRHVVLDLNSEGVKTNFNLDPKRFRLLIGVLGISDITPWLIATQNSLEVRTHRAGSVKKPTSLELGARQLIDFFTRNPNAKASASTIAGNHTIPSKWNAVLGLKRSVKPYVNQVIMVLEHFGVLKTTSGGSGGAQLAPDSSPQTLTRLFRKSVFDPSFRDRLEATFKSHILTPVSVKERIRTFGRSQARGNNGDTVIKQAEYLADRVIHYYGSSGSQFNMAGLIKLINQDEKAGLKNDKAQVSQLGKLINNPAFTTALNERGLKAKKQYGLLNGQRCHHYVIE